MPSKTTVITKILNGELDADLDAMKEAISARRKSLRAQKSTENFLTFKTGSRVRFTDAVHPQYLRGVECTISDKRRTKVTVNLDAAVGRFRAGSDIIVPPEMLEVIS
jgi:hypothetical protein